MSDPRTMTGGDWAELSARADARRLPPSDYGSTRAIQSVAALLRETYARGQRDALSAADQEGWQPIETAPRDGTEFDGWISTGRVENVSWDPDWGDTDGAWLRRIDGDGCVMWVEVDEPMAAWRALPPAPGDAP